MKKLNKKAAFETINKGMIGFISFVLVVILVILLVAVMKEMTIVCKSPGFTVSGGACKTCLQNYTYNASAALCCNSSSSGVPYNCSSGNTRGVKEYSGAAYNATKDLGLAAGLPPQFAQIIVIIVIITGIIGMLGFIAYGAYKKLQG